MTIDWPLATLLAFMFVVMSIVRWRWFKARMNRHRGSVVPPETPPKP